jgi:hypothetical protein
MRGRLRKAIISEVLHCLNQECATLCQRDDPSLRIQSLEDLTSVPSSLWLDRAPLLNDILDTVLQSSKKSSEKILHIKSFLGACLLFGRSQRNSRLPYMIGLILDQGGATNEVNIRTFLKHDSL